MEHRPAACTCTSTVSKIREIALYVLRHPESNFRVLHFAQVPGTIKPSSQVRAATAQLYRSKKLLVPMVLFAYYELPFVVGGPRRGKHVHKKERSTASRLFLTGVQPVEYAL
jgi:hypothetical protein